MSAHTRFGLGPCISKQGSGTSMPHQQAKDTKALDPTLAIKQRKSMLQGTSIQESFGENANCLAKLTKCSMRIARNFAMEHFDDYFRRT